MASEIAQLKAAKGAAEQQSTELHCKLQDSLRRITDSETRIAELDRELRQARQEAEEARARATELDRRILELSIQASRVSSLEEEAADLRKKVEGAAEGARDQGRQLDEARRSAEQLEEQRRQLRAQLDETAAARDQTARENTQLLTKAADLEERVKRAAAQISEADGRVKSLERELAKAKEWEAKAREQASELASLRPTVERLTAEVRRTEAARKDQEGLLGGLRQTVADLSKKLQDASAVAPVRQEGESRATSSEGIAGPVEPASARSPGSASRPPEPTPAGSTREPEPQGPSASVAAAPPPEPPRPAAPPPAQGAVDASACPPEVAEAAAKPQNLFGPAGPGGHPCYVLLELLFRDAMGGVYRAFDRAAARFFAVRFMAGQAGEEQTALIEREVQKLIGMPHPNTLQVRGSGRRQNRLFIVMDLVRAEPLSRAKIQEIPRICRILRDSAEAVHYAHEEGTFHGDVTPENILVERQNETDHAFVKDFALAHLLEAEALRTSPNQPGLMIRSPAYLPPEQMKETRQTLSVAADVYGLGATLYAALAGRPPFEGKDVRQVRSRVMMEEPPPVERLRPDVPGSLAVLVRRAMAKEIAIRYGSAKELAEALTRFLEGKGTRIISKPPVSSSSKTEA